MASCCFDREKTKKPSADVASLTRYLRYLFTGEYGDGAFSMGQKFTRYRRGCIEIITIFNNIQYTCL